MEDIDDFKIDDFFDGDSTELDFDVDDFNLIDSDDTDPRLVKPSFSKVPIRVDYKNAEKLVDQIRLFPGEQLHTIVSGTFVFGDFIEALVYNKNVIVKNMYISTLSYSQENADSLVGMVRDGRIEKLTLVISNYFYSHEKRGLLKYFVDQLGEDLPKVDILVIRNHTKICLMEISNIKLVLTGSSNLRSSRSIEQFTLQESPVLYEFYKDFFDDNERYNIRRI